LEPQPHPIPRKNRSEENVQELFGSTEVHQRKGRQVS
jgi:hypothetical protein